MKIIFLILFTLFGMSSHANEFTYTPKAIEVTKNVYAIIGPLGQQYKSGIHIF